MNDLPFHDFQERALDFIWDRDGAALFAPPGMGKTRVLLECIDQLDGRCLVVAPKLVCETTWPSEIRKWGYDFRSTFLHGRNKNMASDTKVDLINYEALPWMAEQIRDLGCNPYKQVIYDELTFLKNPESKRFKAWQKVVNTFKYRIGATGTPIGNHIMNLWSQLFVCDDGAALGKNFYSFRGRYFWSNEYTYKYEAYDGAEKEILKRARKTALALDINELDMPPLVHSPIYLQMSPAVRKVYEELQQANTIEDLDVYAMNAGVKSGKARQVAAGNIFDNRKEVRHIHNAKIEWLKQIVDELDGSPCLVAIEWSHDYEAICKALGYDVPALYGKTPRGAAAGIVEQWNAGEIPVLVMHPRSAAYGINMQDSGNHMVWFTVPWSTEMVLQGIARLWRQGQKNRVVSHYLLIEGTEDERVFNSVQDNTSLHERAMKALL